MHDVLFLHYGDAWIRGSETCLLQLLQGLDRSRFRPLLACNQPLLRDACSALGIEAHVVEIPEIMIDGPQVHLELAAHRRARRQIERLVAGRRIRLVYCNSGRPGQLGARLARRLGARRLCHLHAPFYRRYYALWMLWNADTLVFVSDATRRESLAPWHRRRRTVVIHNGVDLARFQPLEPASSATACEPGLREKLGLPADVPVIAQIGSLIERKGVATLLAAFARVAERSPARLVLAGDGPDRASFQRLAGQLGVGERVHFLGEWSAPETLWRDVVDVNVLASRMEALPLSLLEASACGVASVSSDVGGSREIVADGETGLLFPSQDVDALTERLLRLLADPALRARFGAAARRRAEREFGLERYVRAVEREIEALVGDA